MTTRLELIAEIVRKMNQELKEDNDRAEEKELLDIKYKEEPMIDPDVIRYSTE
jgi:hypothetical protein